MIEVLEFLIFCGAFLLICVLAVFTQFSGLNAMAYVMLKTAVIVFDYLTGITWV